MKHITTEYNRDVNKLTLTHEEYSVLEPFLLKLGIRCRSTEWNFRTVTIQAENCYKSWANVECHRRAQFDLTEDSITAFKR